MKNYLLSAAICILTASAAQAQTYFTKNGKISFFSRTSMENIDAVNNQVVSVLDSKSGTIQFSVLMSGFIFKKALMQEHFNEKYIESEKFPKGLFKGKITDLSKVDFTKDGTYNVTVAGDLTIHGVTNKVSVPGTITMSGGKLSANATFKVLLADYKIEIESTVKNNISNSIEIKVDCNYQLK